jgi:hypothetical protein
LNGSNYVKVSWGLVAGATSYTVLRFNGVVSFPGTCTSCTITTGNTTGTFNDTGGALGALTYAPMGVATGYMQLINNGVTAPAFYCSVNGVLSTCGSGGGSSFPGCTSDGANGIICTGNFTGAGFLDPGGIFTASGLHTTCGAVTTPAANNDTLFYNSADSDKLYRKDSGGTCNLVEGGGGGGTPGSPSGSYQYNNSGSFAGQAFRLSTGGSTTAQSAIECASFTVSLAGGTWTYPGGTTAATATTIQELTLITGIPGSFTPTSILVSETTQFTSGTVTFTKVSIGRTGSTTDDEMLAQTPLMQSSGDVWFAFDRPQPPVVTGTYSVVMAFRTTGGNVSDLTAGSATYKLCGY